MNPRLHEIEKLFGRVIDEIKAKDEQCTYLLRIYNDLVLILSEASSLHFNTLFARVSFIASRYPMGKEWSYALQIPRREIYQRTMTDDQLLPVLKASVQYLFRLCHAELNGSESTAEIEKPNLPKLPIQHRAGRFKKKFARVIAIEWDSDNKLLTILDEEEPDVTCILHYCVPGVNDIFSDTLELALEEMGMPLILGLTDIDCTEQHQYFPSYIIIVPDLLLDVTAITQVMTTGSNPQAVNAMDIFLPSLSTDPIMIGQVANFFLDELIRDTTKTFAELFAASFKIYPIEFVRMSDEQVKAMRSRMQTHYDNIRRVIEDRFPVLGIQRHYCVIEPSYFSPQYGIKGRLDLYFEHSETQTSSIIELKSNHPFRPNSYGLSSSNYHQTLLYDLLIKSSHAAGHRRANFILYSAESQDTLRFAVTVDSIQKETIHNRNQLVLLQFRLMRLDEDQVADLFLDIHPRHYESLKGYVKRNIENWASVYAALSPGEQTYFKSFVAFITREHMLARIGSEKGDGSGGLAGLWLDKIDAKEERYQILQSLELILIEKDQQHTTIKFLRSERTNPLANFRAGDIVVMYPYEKGQVIDPTKYQLHRANVISVDAQYVIIRLRNMQIHTEQLENIKYWNLEYDLLDSSFKALYQSLWLLMNADVLTRQIILGLIPPHRSLESEKGPIPFGLSENQANVFHEAINAGSLYLLWGPPGTGKTSMMLKSWVWYYFTQTASRIVLLAYTNKAVDEICEALHESGPETANHYIRIGSRSATGASYRHRLLDQMMESLTKRAEIKELLEQTRIFVGTVSSLQGKSELFNLVTFDVAIIDEASQLLEPTVVGLLTRFKKSILIGDHMQLPAISIQPEKMSKLKESVVWSERIGLTDLSMSYFERLYRLYQSRGWHYVIGTLYEQGRMHNDIMRFTNQYVYQGYLKPVDANLQGVGLADIFPGDKLTIFKDRLIFIPTKATLAEIYLKTNQEEASITIELIALWQKKIMEENLAWSIGVITPFRAQIASIIHLGYLKQIDLSNITIDTVERYQGGARDIIIMSSAVNSQRSLSKITSVNSDGVDRKLNVAVTRARQQFVLIGNQAVLESEPAYRSLIAMSKNFAY
jgi:DNA replication ATP-dependent helicase Dna2